ncbi:ParA family protein [Mycobacterium timonense]|uniref:Chromosome partitioning protein ParA n=2 Tax=Mycobacterium TaxID=1763 RepID=A0AAW5SEK2_MYCBC|nr:MULTISPECIES: ParA family protein [Mycobacterium]ETB46148.1 chromosome partitioning protein ParA [Mycobacterium avium 10-5560]MCV6993039.1 ParA family protein [Mycobacterium bouchedurhonense]MCV6994698.1 ParA family protein [Mycobacterium timonense]ORA44973.1 chromosome partitioning protein ParA [Mycobacterium bouchedurhonense]CQD23316.1 cobyrinic acid a,c-diamide synthase [Mycobacterium europaeum]
MTMNGPARAILVANQKGGVGKSTTVAAIAEMIAAGGRRGYRVLVVDGDQQANLTVEDLGVDGDQGRSLAQTLQFGAPLVPIRDVRTNLDLIAGGPQLAVVGASAHLMAENGINMTEHLQTQLEALCAAEAYDVVVIDSGPGDVPLLDTYLSVANYLLIPTRDDQASIGGVERLARRFWRARNNGALIQLLGVLLFDVNPRATKRNQDVFDQINEMLEGSGTTPFDITIRSAPAAAVDMRTHHKTAGELVALANDDRRLRLSRLKDKQSPDRTLWTSDPTGLAADYQELVRQIVKRLARFESMASSTTAEERVG